MYGSLGWIPNELQGWFCACAWRGSHVVCIILRISWAEKSFIPSNVLSWVYTSQLIQDFCIFFAINIHYVTMFCHRHPLTAFEIYMFSSSHSSKAIIVTSKALDFFHLDPGSRLDLVHLVRQQGDTTADGSILIVEGAVHGDQPQGFQSWRVGAKGWPCPMPCAMSLTCGSFPLIPCQL